MHGREGERPAEDAIRRGLRAWAVERYTGSPGYRHRETAIVFGRNRSDALRRASAPARLGEEIHGDVTYATRIASGWDEPITWPICGFCHGQPVGDAASWVDGKPRPPAACPRCGETNTGEAQDG